MPIIAVMKYIFASIAVFLCCVLTAGEVSATPPKIVPLGSVGNEINFSVLPNQPMFSADVDFFLGQQRRRRVGGGGRVWANVYYGDTTLKPKEGGRIDPRFYGLQVGFDLGRSHGVFSTFFLNVNQSRVKFGEDFGGGSSKIDNILLGYGRFIHFSMSHFVFAGSIGYDRYEVSRLNTGKGDGLQMNFFGEFGLNLTLGQWAIKPFYALQYDFLYHGRIGSSSDSLHSDWNGHGLQQLMGLRLNWRPMPILKLQSRSVWVHEFLDNPPPFYRARFSSVYGISTPAIMFHRGSTGRDWAWLGIGARLEPVFRIYLFLDYDVLINERHVTHVGSLGLCLGW